MAHPDPDPDPDPACASRAPAPYRATAPGSSHFITVRGLRTHLLLWNLAAAPSATPQLSTAPPPVSPSPPPPPPPPPPPLVLLHGWMDVAASFQFVVDALQATALAGRCIVAPDWRGFGLSDWPAADSYWFPDYLGDLDAVLDALPALGLPGPVDLVGHSMGGNVAMLYAGVRPERIRRLVNLEGFGTPSPDAQGMPKRLAQWLDALKSPATLRSYDSLDAVAARLQQNNPLLAADKAAWLAPRWAAQQADGRWHIRGDPAHKRVNPSPTRRDDTLACWARITAPVLWAEGDRTQVLQYWGDRYPRGDFEARLALLPDLQRVLLSPCGHMLHHDQPQALAAHLAAFLA